MSNFQRLGPQLLTVVVLAIWAFSLEMLHTYYLFLMNLKETGQLPQQVVCVLPCFRGRKRRNSKQQLQIFHFLLPYHTGKVMYPYACKNWISLKSYWPSGEKLFKFSFMASKFEFFFLMCVYWWLDDINPHWGEPSALPSLPTEMLVSSGNTSQPHLGIIFHVTSRHRVAQSSSHIKFSITATLFCTSVYPDGQVSSILLFCFGFNLFFPWFWK